MVNRHLEKKNTFKTTDPLPKIPGKTTFFVGYAVVTRWLFVVTRGYDVFFRWFCYSQVMLSVTLPFHSIFNCLKSKFFLYQSKHMDIDPLLPRLRPKRLKSS